MNRGRLIVLEGAEGVGKSTQVRRLAHWLRTTGEDPLVLREPGGTPFGEAIRKVVLEADHAIAAEAEALLFMASRAELVAREIAPALFEGRTVLLDRFFLSTYAYQVVGRDLPDKHVTSANLLAVGDLRPALTLLLTLSRQERDRRLADRGRPDRIERAGDAFHRRVDEAFESFLRPEWQAAHPECGPIVAVDAAGDEASVFNRVLAALSARWPETFASSAGLHQ